MAKDPAKADMSGLGKTFVDVLKLLSGKDRILFALFGFAVFVLLFTFFSGGTAMKWVFYAFMVSVAFVAVVLIIYRVLKGNAGTFDLSSPERRIVKKMNLLEQGLLVMPKRHISGPISETHKSVLDLLQKLLL